MYQELFLSAGWLVPQSQDWLMGAGGVCVRAWFSSGYLFWGKRSYVGNGLVRSFQTFKIYRLSVSHLWLHQTALRKGRAAVRQLWSPKWSIISQMLEPQVMCSQTWPLRILTYPSNEFRPDVGFFLKLQHKGQRLFVYLAGVESFVNSQESVPLSLQEKPPIATLRKTASVTHMSVPLIFPHYWTKGTPLIKNVSIPLGKESFNSFESLTILTKLSGIFEPNCAHWHPHTLQNWVTTAVFTRITSRTLNSLFEYIKDFFYLMKT